MPATADQLAWFAARHAGPGVVVLPNAWDPGSAALMAEAGFEAIATTSAGIAHAQGTPDGALGRDEMLAHAARIARAVPVPVTADLEHGYGPRAEDVALTAAAAREAVPAGRFFVLNARTDPYLARRDAASAEENLAETVRRARAYVAAGADCVFVPGPMDAATVGRLTVAVPAPLSVLGARAGREPPLTVSDFQRLGVRRVSVGGSLALATMGFVRGALVGMGRGVFVFGPGAPTSAEMDRLMASFAPAGYRTCPPDQARARERDRARKGARSRSVPGTVLPYLSYGSAPAPESAGLPKSPARMLVDDAGLFTALLI